MRRSQIDRRASRRPARQCVSDTHSHKPDAQRPLGQRLVHAIMLDAFTLAGVAGRRLGTLSKDECGEILNQLKFLSRLRIIQQALDAAGVERIPTESNDGIPF
jgi:hypothetical protein